MIHRSEHESNYMMINNELARDSRLSLEARGLLVLMLSMADDWNFSVKGLMNQTGLKRFVVLRLTKELKDAGYLTYTVEKGKGGIFALTRWDLYEDCTAVCFDRSRKTPQSVKTNRGEKAPQSDLTAVRKNRSTVKPQYGETAVRSNGPIRNNNSKEIPNNKNNKVKEKNPLDDLSPELRQTFEDFMEMRKKIKAPMTDRGLELAIKKAKDLGGDDPEKIKAIVEQSIRNSWRGLFPLKEETRTVASKAPANEIDWEEVERLAGGDA